MTFIQIVILALIQGLTELLPVSSSAHVIVAEKLMGLDPSDPKMTFLLVMLHTGTMFAVLWYFRFRWRKLNLDFLKKVIWATGVTGVVGLGLKAFIEKVILGHFLGESHAEIEHLFKSLPLIAIALGWVGGLIFFADRKQKCAISQSISMKAAVRIGLIQGLCLPFRGFSRSGATISVGLMNGVSRALAEDFSFALAVVLTPPVVVRELLRLGRGVEHSPLSWSSLFSWEMMGPGVTGMLFSFLAGLGALRWLSSWLEQGRWKYFGLYCMVAAVGVLSLHVFWFT